MTERATTDVGGLASGGNRHIAAYELLHTTTDLDGVITSGNRAFVKASGYRGDDLVGRPHNVVRHPDVPAGLYHTLWAGLLGGRPMAAYLKNLTQDGSTYWVFACLVPVRDGFTSVQLTPMSPLAEAAKGLYAAVASFERERAMRHRDDRSALATVGAEQLRQALTKLGYADYEDFMRQALPAEIAARGRLLTFAFSRPLAGGPLGEMLRAATSLDYDLEEVVQHLGEYASLTDELTSAATTVLETARRLQSGVTSAAAASAEVAAQAPVLRNVAAVMVTPMNAAVAALTALAPRLSALRLDVAELSAQIALGQVHLEAVGAFAADVVDGLSPVTSIEQVPALCDTVGQTLVAMSTSSAGVNDHLMQLAGQVHETSRLLADFRHFLGEWRILVMRRKQGVHLADHLAPIDAEYEAVADQLEGLQALARRCQNAVVPFDLPVLEASLQRIRASAALV
jgi:PAS domain S-box-containing protein